MKVAIGVPSGDDTKTDTGYSLLGLFGYSNSKGYELELHSGRSADPSQSQNTIIWEAMIRGKCDAVLLHDSDMAYPPDALEWLDRRAQDIVGCIYHKRQPPFELAFMPLSGEKAVPPDRSGLEPGDVATGLVLIRREVLEAVAYPWIEAIHGKHPDDFVSGDFNLCRKARALGFSSFGDWDLSRRIAHICGNFHLRLPALSGNG